MAPWFRGRFFHPPRVDKGQRAIIQALELSGANVEDISGVGKGCPDLLVGVGSDLFLVEVKAPEGPRGGKSKAGQKLNDIQLAWKRKWEKAPVYVIRTPEEAIDLIRLVKP